MSTPSKALSKQPPRASARGSNQIFKSRIGTRLIPVEGIVVRGLFGIDNLRTRPVPYALPKIKNPWVVTSIPSGLGIGRFKSKADALAAVKALPLDLDASWQETKLEINEDRSKLPKELLRTLYDAWAPVRDSFGGVRTA